MDAVLLDAVREGDDAHRPAQSVLEQSIVCSVERKRDKVLQNLERFDQSWSGSARRIEQQTTWARAHVDQVGASLRTVRGHDLLLEVVRATDDAVARRLLRL